MTNIVRFRIYKYSIPLKSEFRISFAAMASSEGLIVEAEDENGLTGYGESSPSERIVGTNLNSSLGIIERLAAQILLTDLTPWQAHKLITTSVIHNGDAKAAVEGAVLDLYCKQKKMPVYRCLGGHRNTFETDITIGIKSIEETLSEVGKYLEEGFRYLKVKVGEDPSRDVSKIKAIRDKFGYSFYIKVDANQGWTLKQAMRASKELERYEIELIEQPLKYWDLAGLRALRKATDIPIALDESVHTSIDAIRAIRMDAADVINIKLMKSGGILEGLKIALISESSGVANMIGCMLETRLGITMAAHLVGLNDNIIYIDLDSDLSLTWDPVKGGAEHLGGGKRLIPDKPGLGVEVDRSRLTLLRTIEQGQMR